jgi:oligopeptide/dipeptide ABC transporter ATP-binding protein
MTLLFLQDVTIGFPQAGVKANAHSAGKSWLHAVQQVSLSLDTGKILGLVGESGSGKSLTSSAILGLVPPPGQVTAGHIWFDGQDLLTLPVDKLRRIRGRHIALIPQDPMTSLNPVYTVGDQLAEVMTLHLGISYDQAWKRAEELLNQVRVPSAKSRLHEYPHQFSGGMRQRVMIAMALSCNPQVLIADEPTTALDVTVQAQVLDLLQQLQRDRQMAILLITHDLGVVAEVCDQVAVMYAGRIVEEALVHELFSQPKHPYTQGLLSCIPRADGQPLKAIVGQPPQLKQLSSGCAFAPRCPNYLAQCDEGVPPWITLQPHQGVRCINA